MDITSADSSVIPFFGLFSVIAQGDHSIRGNATTRRKAPGVSSLNCLCIREHSILPLLLLNCFRTYVLVAVPQLFLSLPASPVVQPWQLCLRGNLFLFSRHPVLQKRRFSSLLPRECRATNDPPQSVTLLPAKSVMQLEASTPRLVRF